MLAELLGFQGDVVCLQVGGCWEAARAHAMRAACGMAEPQPGCDRALPACCWSIYCALWLLAAALQEVDDKMFTQLLQPQLGAEGAPAARWEGQVVVGSVHECCTVQAG